VFSTTGKQYGKQAATINGDEQRQRVANTAFTNPMVKTLLKASMKYDD
jgi:hypothetical protein